jgi:hypothetical protein
MRSVSTTSGESLMESYIKKHPTLSWIKGLPLATCLYRGYVAVYEIIDEQLYLIQLHHLDTYQKQREKGLNSIIYNGIIDSAFPKKKKLPITWHSAVELICTGPKKFPDRSFQRITDYTNYHFIDIVDGRVERQMKLTHNQFSTYLKIQRERSDEAMKSGSKNAIEDWITRMMEPVYVFPTDLSAKHFPILKKTR